MLTFWEDTDAIKRFAGDDYTMAKYYDFDYGYLIEMEAHVRHYEIYPETCPINYAASSAMSADAEDSLRAENTLRVAHHFLGQLPNRLPG
jgi:hypothetical protein